MGSPKVSFHERLYGGELADICELIRPVEQSASTIMVIGHNPGFTVASRLLSGTVIELKTAHVAVLTASLDDWFQIGAAGVWNLETVITPKTEIIA